MKTHQEVYEDFKNGFFDRQVDRDDLYNLNYSNTS